MSEVGSASAAHRFWTVENLAACVRGAWVLPPGEAPSRPMGAALDAREVTPGQVFFAMPGERADGRSFLAQAASNGAAMAVVAREGVEGFSVPAGLAVLGVDDPATAIADLARAYRQTFATTRVVGTTGSNGKTTTVRLIDAVLKGGGKVGTHAQKSFNNHLGLPLTLLNVRPGDDYVVCELGTSSPGEIGFLTEIARPSISVIVSIGRAHLEKLGSLAGVAHEKAAILRQAGWVEAQAVGLVPAGVAELERELAGLAGCRVLRVGEHLSATMRVTEIVCGEEGTSFTLARPGGSVALRVPLLGAHNAHNAAIAATVGELCGLSDEQIASGLAAAPGASMRLDRRVVPVGGGEITVLNDAYNANPDSTRAGVRTLASMSLAPGRGGRRVAVLGDLLELGAQSAEFHAEVVTELVGLLAGGELDRVVLVGPRFAEARAGVRFEGVDPDRLVSHSDPSDESIDAAAGLLCPGDVVLLKASRGMRLERVMDALGRVCR